MASREPCLYDHVTLQDDAQGIIKFIGSLSGRDDVYYGVDLTVSGKHSFNNNTGTIKNVQYFITSNGKNGRLCKKKSIKYYKLSPESISEYPYGKTIYVDSAYCEGTIKYIGIPPDKNSVHIGVELDTDNGDCDGTYSFNGARYFQTKPKYALYFPLPSSSNQSASNTKTQTKTANPLKNTDDDDEKHEAPKVTINSDGNKQIITGTKKNKVITTVMKVNSGIDSGGQGSIKDRMSMWNKKTTDDKKPSSAQKETERIKKQNAQQKAQKVKQERDERARDIARQEAAEKERKQKEEREKKERERLAKEEKERKEKERKSQQAKARQQKEAMAKKERERKEREAKARRDQLEREKLEKEEKERKQREIMIQKEKIRKENEAKAKAEQLRKETEAREKKEREQKERIKRQKEAFEAKERERKEREQKEKQAKLDKEARLKISRERAERARKERAQKQKEEAAKAEKDRQEKLRKQREEKEKVEKERKQKEQAAAAKAATSSGVDTGSIYTYDDDDDDDDDEKAAEMRRRAQEEEEAELERQMIARKKRKAEEDKKKATSASYNKNKKNDTTAKKDGKDELQDMMSQMNAWKQSKASPAAANFQRKKPAKNALGGLGFKKGRKFSNAPKAKSKYSAKDLEAVINKDIGKNVNQVTMVKLDKYEGDIPLVLYLLGNELYKANKFGTFKMFEPQEMQKHKDNNHIHNTAWNIYSFLGKMPTPLLHTVSQEILNKALSKDVMKDVIHAMDEPYASTLCYLWDILAKVAMESETSRMGQQQLGKVFGPMVTMVTQEDVKGNRVSMNVLAASRMMAMFRRGIEWRMELAGFNFDDSDDDDSD